VHLRAVDEAVREQVAPPRAVAVVGVVADPPRGAGEVRQHRRRAGEELEVEHRVDPLPADSGDRRDQATERREQAPLGYRDHVLRPYDLQHVEDRPVLLEHHEEHVLPPDPLDGLPQGRRGEHRRSLLHELEEQDAAHRGIALPPVEEPAPEREHRAGRDPQPAVDETDRGGLHDRQDRDGVRCVRQEHYHTEAA